MDRNPVIRVSATRAPVIRFAELLDDGGRRLHVGCVMSAGEDWVEVSLPEHFQLPGELRVRFPPALGSHVVRASWRAIDRVGFTYPVGGPPHDLFAGLAGLLDPRPATLMTRR